MSQKTEETGLVRVVATQEHQIGLKEVKELLNLEGDENLLRQVMTVSAGLYADYEKKKAALAEEKVAVEINNAELKSGLEELEKTYVAERDAVYLAEVPNPQEALREYWPNVSHVRGQFLKYFFETLTQTQVEVERIIQDMDVSERTVRKVLKYLLRSKINHFLTTYEFDTAEMDADLEMLMKTYVPGYYDIGQGKSDEYIDFHETKHVRLERNGRYPFRRFLEKFFKGMGNRGFLEENELEALTRSEEWLDKLVDFVMATRKGNEKINTYDELLAYLVRFTKLIEVDRKYWAKKQELENGKKKVPDEHENYLKLRYGEELALMFPNLKNNDPGLYRLAPRCRGSEPEREDPQHFTKAPDKKRKPAEHVTEEFRKVTYKKWEAGEEKDIIGPISRIIEANQGEFVVLKDYRDAQKSTLARIPLLRFLTEKNKIQAEQLERKYGKPDENAEKLYNLYNMAIYYHNIGKALLDKGADEAQRDMGLKYMLFAAGLTRVLDLMVSQLEVKLSVQKVSREFGMSEFVQFAEALEALANDPLSREVEKVIGDSMNKFRAALEAERVK